MARRLGNPRRARTLSSRIRELRHEGYPDGHGQVGAIAYSELRAGKIHRNPSGKHITGYPDKGGAINNWHGKPTGWQVVAVAKDYRLPDVLSWMTDTAHAVVVQNKNQIGVGLSYGRGMIFRGVVLPGLTIADEDELEQEAIAEAEYWLQTDIEDAERHQGEPEEE